jgi:acyl-CoA synthetase (AMP-forming)/AMP-acid ligase II
MSYSTSSEQTAAVAAALAQLGVRPRERVLIMLPDGPGFAEAFAGTIKHQAVPLPVNPLLAAHDIAAAATKTGARLLLASAEQIHTLTDLGTQPPVLIDGPQGPWVAALRLCSVSDNPTRKQVCCCHTPTPSLLKPDPTTAVHRKNHRHKPMVTGSLGPNRGAGGLGQWRTAAPPPSHRGCRSAVA